MMSLTRSFFIEVLGMQTTKEMESTTTAAPDAVLGLAMTIGGCYGG